jgi:hypothetical protein
MQRYLTKFCFYRIGNLISILKKDHDWTLSQTTSDEVTSVSQKFIFILFSHILQGLGRSSPSPEILKPVLHTFLSLACVQEASFFFI